MTKERFLNYTDAIVAIIAAIMVLELPKPKQPVLRLLRQLGLHFFAYFIGGIIVLTIS